MSLKLTADLHQAAYLAAQPQTVYALLSLAPDGVTARLPLDLRLVLDASGSMDLPARADGPETKLALLKDAVVAMLERVEVGDHVTIVRFDHSAKSLFSRPIRSNRDRDDAVHAVRKLRADGGTSVLSGLQLALHDKPLPDTVSRLVLVTDGEGDTSEESGCERLAFDARGQATWLVYGIGVGYNDSFLDRLSQANGGQYVHLSDLATADALFADEVSVMGAVALTNLILTVEPAPGVALVKADRIVPQVLPLPVPSPDFLSADLGDVDRARGQKLLLQLSVPALGVGVHPLATVRAGYHVPARKLLNQQTSLALTLSVSLDALSCLADGEVLRTAQLAGAGRLYTLGLAEAAQGQGGAAARSLTSAAGLYQGLGLADMGQKLVTLASGVAAAGGLDEEVKRTLTTLSRQAWQPPEDPGHG